jgi:hypothetical protein
LETHKLHKCGVEKQGRKNIECRDLKISGTKQKRSKRRWQIHTAHAENKKTQRQNKRITTKTPAKQTNKQTNIQTNKQTKLTNKQTNKQNKTFWQGPMDSFRGEMA